MIEVFKNWCLERYKYQKEWKERTGGKIIGYFCTYTPEEIFYAFDILPIRILGSHDLSDITHPHIPDMFCSFCKDVLACVLRGDYDHLDGITDAQSCLHLRQSYMSSQIHKNFSFSHFVYMPNLVQSDRSVDFLFFYYELLIKSLEEFTSKKITDADLIRAICLLNDVRRNLKDILFLRKKEVPLVTGREFMYICCSKFFVHSIDWLQEISKFKKCLSEKNSDKKPKKIMLIGLEDDNIDLVEIIENYGAYVVLEDSCISLRYFWDEAEEDVKDPLKAIAKRYISRIPCPTKDWPKRTRIDFIVNFIEKFQIDGVIIVAQLKCQPHGADIPFIERAILNKGVPVFVLNYDVGIDVWEFEEEIKEFLEKL